MFCSKAYAVPTWNNDLKTLFLSNKAVIYGINIRTFNAKDSNNNGIIEEELGEERGNFINAIDRLNELSSYGINTIHLLPITTTGKIKALGTAGSLYSVASFNEINPQLKASKSSLSIEEEVHNFVSECHKRNIRVIVDLPSSGSYDLFLKHPELFYKDKYQNPITPSDWTDVRLLEAGTEERINSDVYNLYAEFLDLMIRLDIDGIRATVANLKPASFWKKLIDETKAQNPEFLFLAESLNINNTNNDIPLKLTSKDMLLNAGFDGYNANYSELKNWKTSKELLSEVEKNISISRKYSQHKSTIGNFSTHDQISPILINGPKYSEMITWLNSTLPLNAYYLDGFLTGDTYIYPWGNKKAQKTYTDDEYYFVHRGQLDIFNFSKKPSGKYPALTSEVIVSNKFRNMFEPILTNGNFISLKTNLSNVFAFSRSSNNNSVVVIGNLDFKKNQTAIVNIPKINSNLQSIPLKISSNIPKIQKGKIELTLSPGEIVVIFLKEFEIK